MRTVQGTGIPATLAASAGAAALAAVSLASLGERGYAVPPAAVGAALVAATLLAACMGRAWATGALLAFSAAVLSIQFRVREIGDVGLDWQNGMKFAAWIGIVAVACARWRRLVPLLSDPALALVLAYAALALASTAWSIAPSYTAANATGLVAYACLGALMAVDLGERRTLRVLVWSLSALVAASLACAVVSPSTAYMPPSNVETVYRLIGLASHPNALGQQAAVLCLLAVASRRTGAIGRRWFLLALALGLAALMASRSRFALSAFLLSWGFVALRGRGLILPMAALLATLLAGLFLYAAVHPLPDIDALFGDMSRTGSSSEILTLTGRTELWSVAADRIAERPLMGWGFNATEGILADGLPRSFAGSAVNPHNMIVQTLLSLGFVGSLPAFGFLGILVARMAAHPEPLRDQVTLFVLVVGMGEVEIFAVPVLLTLVAYWAVARHAAASRQATERPFLAWSKGDAT